MKHIIFSLIILSVASLHAEETIENKWSHESEVSVVTVSGNSNSETSSAKQETKYTRAKDSFTAKADYTESKQSSVVSAKSWSASLRYDHKLKGHLSAYIGQTAKSDFFAGTVQEDITDTGLSYMISERDDQKWVAELGYQHSEVNYIDPTPDDSLDKGRVYTKYDRQINENVSGSIFVEYSSAFSKSDTGKELYWVQFEPSLSAVMTSLLSLKLKYNHKYQNYRPAGSTERVDKTFTTALVAKF